MVVLLLLPLPLSSLARSSVTIKLRWLCFLLIIKCYPPCLRHAILPWNQPYSSAREAKGGPLALVGPPANKIRNFALQRCCHKRCTVPVFPPAPVNLVNVCTRVVISLHECLSRRVPLSSAPKNPRAQVKLVVCVLGIYLCYLRSGMLQENIFLYKAEDGSK